MLKNDAACKPLGSLLHAVKLTLFSGVLGAGKTTVIATQARALLQAGERVAVVTNDLANQLIGYLFVKQVEEADIILVANRKGIAGHSRCRSTKLHQNNASA